MKKNNLAIIFLLLLASYVSAQPPLFRNNTDPRSETSNTRNNDTPVLTVSATSTVPLGRWVLIQVAVHKEAKTVDVRVKKIANGPDVDVTYTDRQPNLIPIKPGYWAFTYPAKGHYIAEALAVIDDDVHVSNTSFKIGDPQPDPDPEPDPDDDDDDDIKDVPFPSPDGLRVLIIEETAVRSKLPPEQQLILLSPEFREYLGKITVLDGDYEGWRIWDDDFDADDLQHVSDTWKKAYEAAKRLSDGKRPWIVAANKDKGYSGPLPENIEETKKILEKLK